MCVWQDNIYDIPEGDYTHRPIKTKAETMSAILI